MDVFWVVAPCNLVEVHQRFGGHCCLHHQGDRHLRTHRCENLKSYLEAIQIAFHREAKVTAFPIIIIIDVQELGPSICSEIQLHLCLGLPTSLFSPGP
jgi:hypothetical protein